MDDPELKNVLESLFLKHKQKPRLNIINKNK